MELRDHERQNREAWTKWSDGFAAPGRQSWSTDEISWGIWNLPEREIGAFGDLSQLRDQDVVELGCGTAYFSAWLAKLGARPVGIDITPAQLARAQEFQKEFGLRFPLIEATAEDVPLQSECFDLAISEYGASIWCDPYRWIPEASRLLRPGGRLVFLRNGTLSMICSQEPGPVTEELRMSWFDLPRVEWEDGSVEFHLPPGRMIDLLRECGFEVERLIDLRPPEGAPETGFEHMSYAWARRWPSEEIWMARKREARLEFKPSPVTST